MSFFIFKKRLSRTDVKHRLSFPTKKLRHLPPFPEGSNRVRLTVRVGSECSGRELHCLTRRCGRYLKPVIEGGWTQIVQEKELKEGDMLVFYKDRNHHGHYNIKVNRRIKLMGNDIGEIVVV